MLTARYSTRRSGRPPRNDDFMNNIGISVRSLVEFMFREGDIDNRSVHNAASAMAEGGRLHRKIQRSMGSSYHAEVPLSYTHTDEDSDVALIIDGRADGIIDGDPMTVDEIKGTYRRLDKMEKAENVHLAQATCYAYIYATQNNLKEMAVQITYVHMESELIRRFIFHYTYEELKEWFDALMRDYMEWVRMELEWKARRDSSIKTVDFPYDYRKGQKELVTNVYLTILHGKKLFLEAPTGVGKTIATVFPAVKAMGEGKAGRLFYLTAKTITRTVANDTINLLRSNGLCFKSVTLTAKDKICFLTERVCNPDACPYAKGHFDRINDALFTILTERTDYSRAVIEEYAERFMVCPFEYALDISLFCDGVICDYNYLFDPHVYLKRFFSEGKPADSIFLIDEAHNLVDRGRNMYSATLCKEDVLALKKDIRVYDETLAKRLEKVNKELLSLKRLCADDGHYTVFDSIEPLERSIERLYDRMSDYLENHDAGPVRDKVLDFFFEISHFMLICELMDDKYIIYGSLDSKRDFSVRLYCVDPSENLRACMKRGVASILFSATLLPIQYYKSLLGGDSEDYEVYAQSTFDPDKRGLYLAEGVTTKYTQRDAPMYKSIASYIHSIVNAHTGRYMTFFPSYAFLDNVYKAYEQMYDDTDVMIQSDRMSEEDREAFLACFSSEASDLPSDDPDGENTYDQRSLVGFCVLGGIFSEGIDLQGESLIGSIIVGTGIPMVCDENEIIKNYFDACDGDGMKYAYIYPGFNKVLQAAGRVIRTHDDVGIVALLDYRFSYRSYRELYPREWQNIKRISMEDALDSIMRFWDEWR